MPAEAYGAYSSPFDIDYDDIAKKAFESASKTMSSYSVGVILASAEEAFPVVDFEDYDSPLPLTYRLKPICELLGELQYTTSYYTSSALLQRGGV